MRKFFTLFILLTMLSGAAHAQQMSDKQVVEYLKRAQATGKSQSETAADRLRTGSQSFASVRSRASCMLNFTFYNAEIIFLQFSLLSKSFCKRPCRCGIFSKQLKRRIRSLKYP